MLVIGAERVELTQLPKPIGTNHQPSIFAWQEGYSAAMEGKDLTDNPYYELSLNRIHPAYNNYHWWNKGYEVGKDTKE